MSIKASIKIKHPAFIRKIYHSNMRTRLMLSYSIPVILLCIIISCIGTPFLQRNYRSQLTRIAEQSLSQTDNLLENHVSSMYYLEKLMESNETINHVLGQEDFQLSAEGESFKDFWQLILTFQELESISSKYQIRVYLPDEMIRTPHRYYFRPISELEEFDNWEFYQSRLADGLYVYYYYEDVTRGFVDRTTPHLAILRQYTFIAEDMRTKTLYYQVEVAQSEIERILQNAEITDNSFLVLLRGDGTLLASTDWPLSTAYSEKDLLPSDKFPDWSRFDLAGNTYLSLSTEIYGTNWKLLLLIPEREFFMQSIRVGLLFLFVVLLLILFIFFVSFKVSGHYGKRLMALNQKLKDVEHGDLKTQFENLPKITGDEIDEIYGSFNLMTAEITHLLKEHYQLGKQVTRAEIRILQAQINPHFLYNTLDLINWGALDYGAEDVAQIARDLGQYYRLSLNHGQSVISIREELKHVLAYVNIENVHYDDAITLTTDVADEILDLGCMNIILQPFVENAIVHGIGEHPEIEHCNISISAHKDENDIIFCIRDDGPGFDPAIIPEILGQGNASEPHGYGVRNIHFRLRLSFGDSYGVSYDSKPGFGTSVSIRIPAATCEELNQML